MFRRSSISDFRLPPPDTPSGPTDPPRSISRSYSISISSIQADRRIHSKQASEPHAARIEEIQDEGPDRGADEGPDKSADFPATTPFQDVLGHEDPHQRERERHKAEKMAKRRDSGTAHEPWNPLKWRFDTQGPAQRQAGVMPDDGGDTDAQSPQKRTTERVGQRTDAAATLALDAAHTAPGREQAECCAKVEQAPCAVAQHRQPVQEPGTAAVGGRATICKHHR